MTAATHAPLVDAHGRVLRDLRVSVTDRCNFRCVYCLPETEEAANFYQSRFPAGAAIPLRPAAPRNAPVPNSPAQSAGPGVGSAATTATPPGHTPLLRAWKPRHELLRFEEIERIVRLFVSLGIRKVRLTGGEPLLRQDLPDLVRRLSPITGIEDLAMTTNGFFFPRFGPALRQAGLRRVSFSLDSLDRANFLKLTGRDGLAGVLASIRLARDLGLSPIKVNAVVIRGLNDHEIEDLARWARSEGVAMRFIEFMPLDSGRAWLRELVVPGREILARLQQAFPLVPVQPDHRAETARRWRFADDADAPASAEIGIIAPVTEPFCGHCNRIRLTADGQIRTCLFSVTEHDLKARLRAGEDDASLIAWLRQVVTGKEERHHIGEPGFEQPERTMSCIGG